MSKQKCCTFCRNKGIKEPHDHTIRDFTKNKSPILCPELLKIQCNYCKEKGHTVTYCKILKDKKLHNTKTVPVVNHNKRIISENNCENNCEKNMKDIISNKLQKINTISSMFSALDVDYEEEEQRQDNSKKKSWANITSLNRPAKTIDNTNTNIASNTPSNSNTASNSKSNTNYICPDDEKYDYDEDDNDDDDILQEYEHDFDNRYY